MPLPIEMLPLRGKRLINDDIRPGLVAVLQRPCVSGIAGEILRNMPRFFFPYTEERAASHAPSTRVIGKRNVCIRVRHRRVRWSRARAPVR